jgi:hypothetical protein
MFEKVLKQKIELKENGRIRKISGHEAIVKSIFARAVRGDLKSAQAMLTMAEEIKSRTYTKNVDKMSPKEVHETYLRMIRASESPYSR